MVLRILNVAEAPAGRAEVKLEGLSGASLSTEPCRGCGSRCCRMSVVVSTVEAVRLSTTLGLPVSFSVELTPWSAELGLHRAWPLKLDDGRRYVLRLAREGGYCRHLLRPGQESSRCGVYELRPASCRLYPFALDEGGGEGALLFGSQVHCPVQWLQTEALRGRLTEDLARWRRDRSLDLQVARFWNKGRRARPRERLFRFLEEEVARELSARA